MRDVILRKPDKAQEREKTWGITAYCRYQQRRQSDRGNHRRHGQPCTSLQTVGHRWLSGNIGLMTMELFTPARDVLGAAPSVAALKAV